MGLQLLYDLAIRMAGTPYLYGGKIPFVGLDCSGFVNILLHAYGLNIPDSNAQKLFNFFSNPNNHCSVSPQLGALVFYGESPTSIEHVEMALNALQQVGANGGDSGILTVNNAAEKQAYVKVTPLYLGSKLQGVFVPHYPVYP